MTTRIYTKAEKTRRAQLIVRGLRHAAADTSHFDRQIERIDQAAEDRGKREAAAHARRLDQAKDEVARTRVAERCATRDEKPAAKAARKEAEKRLRLVERATR